MNVNLDISPPNDVEFGFKVNGIWWDGDTNLMWNCVTSIDNDIRCCQNLKTLAPKTNKQKNKIMSTKRTKT